MLKVGLTGGIGSGKSTVARRLAELGAVVVDADVMARRVVEPGQPALAEIAARFGPGVINGDGSLNRAALADIVFADPSARADLEAMTHPRMAELTARIFAEAAPEAILVHDMPLLVEKGLAAAYDLVVVVGASESTRVERLVQRGLRREDAVARMGAQATDAQRRAVADVWLDNDGSPAQLLADVDRLWSQVLVPLNDQR